MKRSALAVTLLGPLAALAALAGDAAANGRPPATSTVHFRRGHEADIVAGMTFGVLLSHDGGATWQWMCEKAVGYGGMYDPIYAYSASGALFATTFDGLKVNRDGCTFAAAPTGMTFISQDALGPDGHLHIAAAAMADAKIYTSADDGTTFPIAASPGQNGDWWDSLVVAPSDPLRVYASGYRFVSMMPKVFLLFKSTDGGAVFTAMSTTGFATSMNSAIDIVGVDPADPQLVYARSSIENGVVGDGIYKSTNGGASWTKILAKSDSISFVARKDGSLVAATQSQGTVVSVDKGANWTPVAGAPHINCLAENSAGELWACTQNYGVAGIPADGFGIMKTTDLTTWTGVLRFQDIQQPVTCAAGTAQQDQCVAPFMGQTSVWCVVKQQLGITSTAIQCPAFGGDTSTGNDNTLVKPAKPGCCETGSSGGAATLFAGLVGAIVLRPRRRARR